MAPEALEAVDVAGLAAAFGRAVRNAGIPCSPERSVRFARALQLTRPVSRRRLYWIARAVFISTRADVEAFDQVFAGAFDGLLDPAGRRGDQAAPPLEGSMRGNQAPQPGALPAGAPPRDGAQRSSSTTVAAHERNTDEPEREIPLPLASAAELLARKDFSELEPHEVIVLRRLMRELSIVTPQRRTRRARRARRGDHLDVRATLRASHRTGGDPVRQVRRRRRMRRRPLVVLCDISGSMEPYSRAFLTFLHGAVGGADAEAFVFGGIL